MRAQARTHRDARTHMGANGVARSGDGLGAFAHVDPAADAMAEPTAINVARRLNGS